MGRGEAEWRRHAGEPFDPSLGISLSSGNAAAAAWEMWRVYFRRRSCLLCQPASLARVEAVAVTTLTCGGGGGGGGFFLCKRPCCSLSVQPEATGEAPLVATEDWWPEEEVRRWRPGGRRPSSSDLQLMGGPCSAPYTGRRAHWWKQGQRSLAGLTQICRDCDVRHRRETAKRGSVVLLSGLVATRPSNFNVFFF